MGVLNFTKRFGLNKLSISQATLDVELGLNGLITNDKFCLTRWGKLMLKADQRPQHRRKANLRSCACAQIVEKDNVTG